jgi:two-component system sensor histidine kinase MtrB
VTDASHRFPRRFRRRLTVTFIAVAGVAGGALALVSFLLAREYRIEGFENRSRSVAELNLRLATEASPSFLDGLVATYRQQEGFDVVGVASRREISSGSPRLSDVPEDLRRQVKESPSGGTVEVFVATTAVGSQRYVVVAGAVPRSTAQLYFFFSLAEVLESLSEFRTSLLLGWVVVALAAALVGQLVARRTLRPVRTASDAARSLAEGLLDTRLPVRTSDEFGAWASYFNQMADALADKIAALSEAHARERRFTADVAHELRTPLGALVTTSSVLEAELEDLPAHQRRPTELVIEGIRRLRRLIEDLLELSELDAGQRTVHLEELSLDEAAAAVLRGGGWQDDVTLEARPTPVLADRHRLERVISNLISNAVIHGGSGVTMQVGSDADGAFVAVSDRGPGIPAENLDQLFDRFYKVRSGPAGPGSGLGLAIAAENARLLGGEISVQSEPGEGSRFLFRLPRQPAAPAPEVVAQL